MTVFGRVVFDTSTLVSAALRVGSLPQVCEGGALISSDADLLVLHPWRGVPILTPAAFLAMASLH